MKKLSDIAASVVPPFQSCANCNSGWVNRGHGNVSRCPCWIAHQAKLWHARLRQENVSQQASSRTKER